MKDTGIIIPSLVIRCRLRLRMIASNRLRFWTITFCLTLTVLNFFSSSMISAQPNANSSTEYAWQSPAVEAVKIQLFTWLDEKKADADAKTKAEKLWANVPQSASEEDVLDRLVQSFALADADAAKLVTQCVRPRNVPIPLVPAWLYEARTAPFAARNLRLFYARWLVQNALYDEAREQLNGLTSGDVVAPATLLFYQSVVAQKLLDRESGLQTLDHLLSGPPTMPLRYRTVAQLMLDDLQDLEEDSLDHISRRMEDIRRRLDLGRAGPKVRGIEDGVIESLDKLIKKLEDEQQRQSQASIGGNLRSSNPAPDSRAIPGKGPGNVEKKNVGGRIGWGDLPPKEREEALQQIGRNFPTHYRDVLEEYFKHLAAEAKP
jgi:hypothetical protein